MEKGYVQVYTGDGKGKTTAALGLAVRAVGAGLKVYFGQFMKKYDYSEIQGVARLGDQVTLIQYGTGEYVFGDPKPDQIEAARQGLETIKSTLASRDYDVVVADEINVAAACGLLTEQDLLDLIALRPDTVELILTGRGALPAIMAAADLVSEMKPVKHYFQTGVTARKGIES